MTTPEPTLTSAFKLPMAHIAIETVVIGAMGVYFYRKTALLTEQMKDMDEKIKNLEKVVSEHAEQRRFFNEKMAEMTALVRSHQPAPHYQPTPQPAPQPAPHYQPTPQPAPQPAPHYQPTPQPAPHYQPTPQPTPQPVSHYQATPQPVSHYQATQQPMQHQPTPQPMQHQPTPHPQSPHQNETRQPFPFFGMPSMVMISTSMEPSKGLATIEEDNSLDDDLGPELLELGDN